MAKKHKVVVTGAAGQIARQLLPALSERYDLRLLDMRSNDSDGNPIPNIEMADLRDKNWQKYRHHFKGADAIVHCAFTWGGANYDPDHTFQAEMLNIQMTYNMYRVAVEENVRRVVVASSNHAADFYESLILDGKVDSITPQTLPLSDNYYGWAKASYEHLGFVFATGQVHGKPLENVHIRIGGPRETDVENCPKGDMRCVRRALAAYISQRDMAQLFIKSIDTTDIRNEHGIPFQVFYGISGNDHAFWGLANARQVIGYEPQDNSAIKFHELVQEHIRVSQAVTTR